LKEIADAGFEIREVLIGRSLGDRYPLDELANVFAKAKPTDVKTGDNPGITHYFDGVGEPAFRANERRVSGGVESWTLHGIADVQIEVHHVIAARVPNQGGLLVRLGYRGMHWLLSDDLDETAIRTFVRGLGPGSLSAGILKWPHHLWLPNGPADRLILGEFLRRVNPHTIVFSNIGHWSHDKKQFEDIQAFVAEELRGTATTAWTRENEKHIMIRAETEPRRRAYHDAIVSRPGPPQGHASLN
jgi:hypothetical protein